MTLILATSWGGHVAIASDSHGSDSQTHQDHGSKLRPAGFGYFGISGSFRWLHVLGQALGPVKRIASEADAAAATEKIARVLKRHGWNGKREKGLPECESLYAVMATKTGHLWTLQADLAILPCEAIAAEGSGHIAGRAAAEAFRQQGLGAVEAARRSVEIAIGMILTVKGTVHLQEVK